MSDHLKDYIREVPDFPKPGIGFKDISPLLKDAGAFARAIEDIAQLCRDVSIDCLLYTSPSPRDATLSRMASSA